MNHTNTLSTVKRSSIPRLLALVLLLTAFGDSARAQKFDFRIVNLLEGVGPVDVHFNNLATASIKGVGAEEMSPISPGLPVAGGTINLKITRADAGTGAALIDQNATVATNTDYEAVAYGSSSAPKLAMLSRPKNKVPTAGQALVRILHAAAFIDSLDVYVNAVGGTPSLVNIKRDSVSKYATVTGPVVTLIVTRNGSAQPITQLVVPVNSLSYNTLVIGGSNVSNVKIHQINGAAQNTSAVKLPVLQGSDVPPAFMRAINAWPQKNVPNVDVYLDGQARTLKMPYRSATERYGPLTGDSAVVSFVTAGDNPGNALLTARVDLRPDTVYAVVLTQFDNGGRTHLLLKRPVSEKPSSPNAIKIRVANATDFYGPITIVLQPSGGDTVRYEEVPFLSYTGYRELAGGTIDLKAYRQGGTEPIFTGNLTFSGGSVVTFLALGDDMRFGVDVLNDSIATLQIPMRSFDPALSVPNLQAEARALDFVNAPNPFSEATRLAFTLPGPTRVTVTLFDALGREIARPLDEQREAGEQSFELRADGMPAGVYTCILRTGSGIMTVRRITVMK